MKTNKDYIVTIAIFKAILGIKSIVMYDMKRGDTIQFVIPYLYHNKNIMHTLFDFIPRVEVLSDFPIEEGLDRKNKEILAYINHKFKSYFMTGKEFCIRIYWRIIS